MGPRSHHRAWQLAAVSKGLEFRLSDPLDADAPSYVHFSVGLDGEGFWPVACDDEAAVEIFIDDILDYLTDFWMPLLLRQTYPLAFTEPPERPTALATAAASRWLQFPESQVEAEQSRVSAFEEAHNLARCFDGQFALPPLWLLRDREDLIIDTGERLARVDFEQGTAALTMLGDQIASRLEQAGVKASLVQAWRAREEASGVRMVELSAGLSTDKAQALIKARYLAAPENLVQAANDNDEIVVAARMAGALPLEDIKRIINLAKGFALHPSEPLAKLGRATREHLATAFADAKPFDQGEAAARLLRKSLQIDVDGVLDVRALAGSLGIEVKEHGLSISAMAGLAICGAHHGPGVLLNRRSSHLLHAKSASREAMLRYTLAHELCHLILDGEHSFTAVDVLSGRMPPAVESRAQSFAGELLFPTRLAHSLWEGHGSPVIAAGLGPVLDEAVERYQVTRSVAAWKVEHAARQVGIDLYGVLNSLARYR